MNCRNCRNPISPGMKFCPHCGQETADRSSNMGSFLQHFLGDYFTFDSKIFKSVSPLITKPGYLSREFMIGRRIRYIPPIRLYIFISIVFFLMIRWLAPEVQMNAEQDFWDDYFGVYVPRLFFILLPIFALFIWLLHSRKRWSFVIHIVFSIHFHAFLFLSGSAYLLISQGFETLEWFRVNQVLAILLMLWWLIYLYIAQKKVYKLSHGKTFLRFALLLILYTFTLVLSSIITLLAFS